MARFNAAVMDGALDAKFQNRFNYLLDLLDTAYIVEKRVSNVLRKVTINPDDLISITVGNDEVFGIDEAGRVFASAISNVSASGYYMTYGYGGSPGMECFYPYTDPGTGAITTERFFAVTPTVYGGILIYGLDSSQDSVLREEFGTDGSYNLYDEASHAIISVSDNGSYAVKDVSGYERFKIYADGSSEDFIMRDSDNKIRVHSYADGGFEIVDTNGTVVFGANGGASEEVWLACKNDNTMQVGVNSTGAYYTNGSVTKNYFKDILTSGSDANGYYIKYNDGTMICYGTKDLGTFDVDTADGALFRGDSSVELTWPATFYAAPTLAISYTGTGLFLYKSGAATTTKGYFTVLSTTSVTSRTEDATYIATGRWKA
jgi:hypothetical protein